MNRRPGCRSLEAAVSPTQRRPDSEAEARLRVGLSALELERRLPESARRESLAIGPVAARARVGHALHTFPAHP